MTTRRLICIWLGSMLLIMAAGFVVERFFPSHAGSDPPLALKPNLLGTDNECS